MNEQLDTKIQAAIDAATAETTEVDSAIVFIKSVPGLIKTAVAQALSAGATPAQLQALADLAASLSNKQAELANALTANTPSQPSAGTVSAGPTGPS